MKKILITLVLLCIFTAIMLFMAYRQDTVDQSRTNKTQNHIVVTAEDLMVDYQKDAYQADKKYENYNSDYVRSDSNYIVIIGTIYKHRKEELSYHVNQFLHHIHLYAFMDWEVRCIFNPAQAHELRDIKVGDTVKIAGYIRMNNVLDLHHVMSSKRKLYNQSLGALQRENKNGMPLYYVTIEHCTIYAK